MRIFYLLLIFSGLYANAQKQVTINGNISGLAEGTKVYLVPDDPDKRRDSTTVEKGSFHFKINIPEAFSYSVRLSREFVEGKWQTFYLDEGVLNIEGQNGHFKNMKLSGSQFVIDYNDYRKWINSHKIDSQFVNIEERHAKAEKTKDTLLTKKLYKEFLALDTLRAMLAWQWVKKHRSSSIGPYLLFMNAGGTLSTTDLETALNEVLPEAKNDFFARRLQAQIDATKATAIGKIAPDFTQADTSGKPVSLHDFKGKYLLLDFWASWCVPCRAENPNVVAALKKYGDKGFTILSVSLDKNKEDWLKAIEKDNLYWTHVSDLKFWDNALVMTYNVQSVPFNLLLDPDGKIVAKNLRGADLDKTIYRYLK